MFGTYFYNKNIRNIVILFGTIFNDITVKRTTSAGVVQSQFKVPINYGPSEKYLTRLEQGPTLDDQEILGITLPRLSFEITTMAYDPARKLQTMKKIREVKPLGTLDGITIVTGGSGYTSAPTVTVADAPTGGTTATATATIVGGVVTAITVTNVGAGYTTTPNVTITGGAGTKATAKANMDANTSTLLTAYSPVPYNFEIDLAIMVRSSDDGAQILEQILPYFTPEFHVTLNEMKTLGIKRDIPVILNSMSTEDTYEGDYIARRALIHTLSFTVQGFIYGPTSDQGIIREVDVNAGTSFNDIDEKLVNVDTKPNPTTADADDDHTFTTTKTIL